MRTNENCIKNSSHRITADVEIPSDVPEGPICAIGGVGSAWSLNIKDQKLVYCYNNNGKLCYGPSTKSMPEEKLSSALSSKKQASKSLAQAALVDCT